VKKEAIAARALPIIIPAMKYPVVFFRRKVSVPMTVRESLLSETVPNKTFPEKLEIIASTDKNWYSNYLYAKQ